MAINLLINKHGLSLHQSHQDPYDPFQVEQFGTQADWHCMAYAIFLLQQYHNGEI